MQPSDHFLFSGEFHYFRVPKALWRDRLSQTRDLGMDSVSIYIPWNWHEPQPGNLDLVGKTLPERDLIGALEAIAKAGLKCIFRPGPFITGEWRNGGLPEWLWEKDPQILSLDAWGNYSGLDRPYPAVTYDHPIFRQASAKWFENLFGPVKDYLSSKGGPIVNFQLDDEPSYWHVLSNPLLTDYNPVLISDNGSPSLYARWLINRYCTLDNLNANHAVHYAAAELIEPPRQEMANRAEFIRYQDWLDFKLSRIDKYVGFLYDVAQGCGVDVPISMLYPYLLASQAGKFTDYIHRTGLKIELTDECYLTLFFSTSCPEQKLGHVVSTHEMYHMWRGADTGLAIAMELQGSNASFLTPGSMEILYALTVARGIKGINYFMLVGGENPPGYGNMTGRYYDISAPISTAGNERPHAGMIRKLAKIVHASEKELLEAQPLRDVWLGCYLPYEAASLVGGASALWDAGIAMKYLLNYGENGLSDAPTLQSLLTLSSVSFGCLDLEKATAENLAGIRQLWVFSLDFMSSQVQEKLLAYVESGGNLVILPVVPSFDEHMAPCEILLQAIFRGVKPPAFNGMPTKTVTYTQIVSQSGASLVAPGRATTFSLPKDAVPLAWTERENLPCAFERAIGKGKVTILGFSLNYMPTASNAQKEFAIQIVERANARRHAFTTNLQMVAMELATPQAAFLCVVNPVELSSTTKLVYSLPGSGEPVRLPFVLEEFQMPRQGARLLPVGLPLGQGLSLHHSTCELVKRQWLNPGFELVFTARPGEVAEVAFTGPMEDLHIQGGKIQSISHIDKEFSVLVLRADEEEFCLSIVPG